MSDFSKLFTAILETMPPRNESKPTVDEVDETTELQLQDFLSWVNTNTTGLGSIALQHFVAYGGLSFVSCTYEKDFINFLEEFVINDVFDGSYNCDDEYKKSILNAIVKSMLDELGIKE